MSIMNVIDLVVGLFHLSVDTFWKPDIDASEFNAYKLLYKIQ